MNSKWIKLVNHANLDHLGLIPHFLKEEDPRPAKEQIEERYAHGGGWRPIDGFILNRLNFFLRYPGDPPMGPLWWSELRDERIFVYPHAWVMILKDGNFEVARMD